MKSVNNTSPLPASAATNLVKLPPLSRADIEKLDYLVCRLKAKQTEYVNIYSVCKEKWGSHNKLLYLFFAEYLRRNDFTTVQNHTRRLEYVWSHMIAPRGLSMDGFKYEYKRQHKKKKIQKRSWYQTLTSFLFA